MSIGDGSVLPFGHVAWSRRVREGPIEPREVPQQQQQFQWPNPTSHPAGAVIEHQFVSPSAAGSAFSLSAPGLEDLPVIAERQGPPGPDSLEAYFLKWPMIDPKKMDLRPYYLPPEGLAPDSLVKHVATYTRRSLDPGLGNRITGASGAPVDDVGLRGYLSRDAIFDLVHHMQIQAGQWGVRVIAADLGVYAGGALPDSKLLTARYAHIAHIYCTAGDPKMNLRANLEDRMRGQKVVIQNISISGSNGQYCRIVSSGKEAIDSIVAAVGSPTAEADRRRANRHAEGLARLAAPHIV